MTSDSTIVLGATVRGIDGSLGVLSRVVVDDSGRHATAIVVKSGNIFPRERVVPIAWIEDGEGDSIDVAIDEDEFERFDDFAEDGYEAEGADYAALPEPAAGVSPPAALDRYVAGGGQPGLAGFARHITPSATNPDVARLALRFIDKGTHVLDFAGEKVGEVADLRLSGDGDVMSLTVRKGLIMHEEATVSGDAVAGISGNGLRLRESADEVFADGRGE